MAETLERGELLWRQYKIHVDLLKYYLSLIVKVNTFHYAVTGAITSFYFTRRDLPDARYALVLPVVLSLGIACLELFGMTRAKHVRAELIRLSGALGLLVFPDALVLTYSLLVSSLALLVISGGLIWLIVGQ